MFPSAPTLECDGSCWDYLAVDRISLAMALYHLFLMILLLGVSSSQDPRSKIQNGLWPVKFLIFCGTIVGCFFINNSVFVNYWIAALVFSALFILIQSMILVDFAHSTAETWVANAEETGFMLWNMLLVGTAFVFYAAVIVGSALLYNYYAKVEGCGLNSMYIRKSEKQQPASCCTLVFEHKTRALTSFMMPNPPT